MICDTCAHLVSSDDKWKWVGVWEIARVQRFILGVAMREQAIQRLEPLRQIPLLSIVHEHVNVYIKHQTRWLYLYIYQSPYYANKLYYNLPKQVKAREAWKKVFKLLRKNKIKKTKQKTAVQYIFWGNVVLNRKVCFNDHGNAGVNKKLCKYKNIMEKKASQSVICLLLGVNLCGCLKNKSTQCLASPHTCGLDWSPYNQRSYIKFADKK